MTRRLIPFALTLALFAPLAATAQTPPVPGPAPDTAAAPKKNDHVHGKITAADAAARTVTLFRKKGSITLTLASDAKIFKVGDKRKNPTGTFADLLIDTQINAKIIGDPNAPTATEVHIRAPKANPTGPGTAPAKP